MQQAVFVLLGEGGVGKSTLINILAREERAGISNPGDLRPCTSKATKYETDLGSGDAVLGKYRVILVDTPGLNSPKKSDENIVDEVWNELQAGTGESQLRAIFYLQEGRARRAVLWEKFLSLKSTNPHLVVIGEDKGSFVKKGKGRGAKTVNLPCIPDYRGSHDLDEITKTKETIYQELSKLIKQSLLEAPPAKQAFLTSLRSLGSHPGNRGASLKGNSTKKKWYKFW